MSDWVPVDRWKDDPLTVELEAANARLNKAKAEWTAARAALAVATAPHLTRIALAREAKAVATAELLAVREKLKARRERWDKADGGKSWREMEDEREAKEEAELERAAKAQALEEEDENY